MVGRPEVNRGEMKQAFGKWLTLLREFLLHAQELGKFLQKVDSREASRVSLRAFQRRKCGVCLWAA